MTESKPCPSCGGQHLSEIYRLEAIPVQSCILLDTPEEARDFPRAQLRLMFCDDCGFVFNADFNLALVDYASTTEESQHFSGTFNRFARLLFSIAIEAAAARTMSEGIMLQFIRELATEHPDDFAMMMGVSRDGQHKLHARIRSFHNDIKVHVEQEAIRRLKKPVSNVQELFEGQEEDVMHG